MSRALHLHNNIRDKKPLPGLMIGKYGIQYIDLDSNKKPKKFDEITFANGDDEDEVKEGIQRIVKKNKFNRVNLVVPEFEISTFFVTLYIEKKQKERDAILDYIQKNTQIDPKDIVLDYDVVSHKDNVLNASVLIMSKMRHEWYLKILKESKVTVARFIGENIALSKSLIKEENNEPHIIINVTPQYTTLSVVGDNVLYKTEIIKESLDIDNLKRFNKKVNSFILEWYSHVGRVVHDRTHHIVVITHKEELTKKVISSLRNTLSHINIRKGFAWDNCFTVDNYIPPLHKKDLYRYSQVIGGSLIGRK